MSYIVYLGLKYTAKTGKNNRNVTYTNFIMDEIDLEITNYSNKDIEFFFRLDETPNYTADDITRQVYEVQTELMSDRHFPKQLKRKFMEFIQVATGRLYESGGISPAEVKKPLIQDTTLDYPEQSLESLMTRKSEIVRHPATQYVNSNPSTIHKGDLNPLNNRILTRSLTVDTKFRDNWSTTKSTDFTINLPTKLSKVASMQLTSIEFPVAFYGISQCYGNNVFTIELIGESHTHLEVITIPDGNYTNTELIDAINAILAASATPAFTLIEFEYNSITGKVTINRLSPATFTINLYFNQNSSGEEYTSSSVTMRAGYVLGFTNSTYTGGTSYTSEGVINPSPINYVYLAIEDFNQNVTNGFISATSNTITSSDIIARITVNDDYFRVINDTTRSIVTEPREYFGPVDITRLRIRVYDDYGRILDMNNADFSFCLTMKQIYNL